MKSFITKFADDFKKFILRGNVMDMAVGVIIGAAFGKVVSSLVSDIMMPVLSLFTGKIDYTNLFISLNGVHYDNLESAIKAGAPLLKYGDFITVLINFLILAFSVFVMIRAANKLSDITNSGKQEEEKPTRCPYCFMEINKSSKKCAYCTTDLADGWQEQTE